ncbi:MAG: DUF2232 domain-containing protein [candidate division Zixibacteria bacterium]|nr:DUF2232 domain-containing protein [candidate division Zixibacteria bacterium]
MNLIDKENKQTENNNHSIRLSDKTEVRKIPILIAMITYSVLLFGNSTDSNSFTIVGVSTIVYFITIYLFYGIASLAYYKNTYLLWGSAICAVVLGCMLSGSNNILELLLSWSSILFAGVITGKMNINSHKQLKVYIYGGVAVIVFSLMLMYPIWSELITVAKENSQLMIEEFRQNLTTIGYSSEAISDNILLFQKMLAVFTRLLPSTMILGILLQFSVGYLLFLLMLDRKDPVYQRIIPFSYWKVPFSVTPIVIVSIIIRLIGGEQLKIIADNILTILSVYYCLTGLSVVEYYLKKLNISRFMKIMFYILLFFTQLVGYFVIVLLGFIDSFADWRKVHSKEIIGMK